MTNFKFETDADGIALVTWDMPDRTMNVITMDTIKELSDDKMTLIDKMKKETKFTKKK